MTAASRAGSFGALIVVVALGANAFADQREQADAAFKRGRDAFKAGKYEEACEAFDESFAFDPQLGTRFNLAQCYEKIGKLATAHTIYNELLATDENAVRKQLIKEALESLPARVPKIKVVVDNPPPNLVVTVQDAKGVGRPATIQEPLEVDTGDYKVIASGTGVRDWVSPVTHASEGQTTQIVVVFVPAEAKTTTSEETPSIWDPRERGRLRAAAIIASGGALVVTSLVLGYSAYSRHSDAEDLCPGGMCPTQMDLDQAMALHDSGQLRGTFSTVLFGVGVAAIGTGTVMYLLAKHSGTTVSPHVGESNAGVTLSGNF